MSTDPVNYCGLYLPGHDVHWIQAKLAAGDRSRREPAPGHLLEIQPDGLVVVEIDGGVRYLWNHDPDRLQRLVELNGGEVCYHPRWGLLWTAAEDGSYLFCAAADNPYLRVCPTAPPTGDPVDLLLEAGGFSIPGPEYSVSRYMNEESA